MRRSNIMDILNEQRKQEPLKKIVSGRTLISGLVLLVGGVLLGFVMPVVVANMTKHYLGAVSYTHLVNSVKINLFSNE